VKKAAPPALEARAPIGARVRPGCVQAGAAPATAGAARAGGAWAGHKLEQKVRSTKRWDVVVRMENDSERTLSTAQQPAWRVGDRVRLTNGVLQAERRG